MGNCIISDKFEREELIQLLKQLKPNSDILKYDFSIEGSDMSDKDIFLETYGVFTGELIEDIDKINKSGLEQSMCSDTEDLIGILLEEGIDVRAVYYNGILFQCNVFNGPNKGKDITSHLRGIIPNNVDNISKRGITEIHGRLTIDNSFITNNKLEKTVDYIMKDVDERIKEIFTVKMYKIYCEDIEFTSLNKEIDFLEENDFDVENYLLIRNVPVGDIQQAIESLYDTMIDDESTIEMRVCFNCNNAFQYPFENRDDILVINKKYLKSKIYSSIVTGIDWYLDKYVYKPRLIIKPIKIDSDKAIRYINLDHINIADNNNIDINSKIYFYINHKNEVIACDKDWNRLV